MQSDPIWRLLRDRRVTVPAALVSLVAGAALALWASGCGAGAPRERFVPTEPFRPRVEPRPVQQSRPVQASRPVTRRALPQPIRAVWVARFHYRAPADIAEIMANCARAGFNTVIWQVRGDATVAYPSRIEPWSTEYDHQDPGFDPAAIAIAEARRHRLRIEAWVNVMPAWFGKKPPAPRSHVYHQHPEWFLHDEQGKRQPLNEHYVILNPCLPEVRAYIVSVFDELMTRYGFDALHLDYVRFAWEAAPKAFERYPRDARTLALFRQQTGRAPDDDLTAWKHWRGNQLTQLVMDIRAMLAERRPDAVLTAATWGNPVDGYDRFLQNATGWLEADVLDVAYPMAYRADLAGFEANIAAYQGSTREKCVVPGLGIYKHEQPDQMGMQLRRCREWGGDFCLFSYESLFPTFKELRRGKPDPKAAALRRMRLDVLSQFPPP